MHSQFNWLVAYPRRGFRLPSQWATCQNKYLTKINGHGLARKRQTGWSCAMGDHLSQSEADAAKTAAGRDFLLYASKFLGFSCDNAAKPLKNKGGVSRLMGVSTLCRRTHKLRKKAPSVEKLMGLFFDVPLRPLPTSVASSLHAFGMLPFHRKRRGVVALKARHSPTMHSRAQDSPTGQEVTRKQHAQWHLHH
jgi:hypothetical protein